MDTTSQVSRDMAIYPKEEIQKHVKDLDDTCIFELEQGHLYIAVITYAEEHFKHVGSFAAKARARKDNEGEDAIGIVYHRYMGRRNRFDIVDSQERKNSKVPELSLSVGIGTFVHDYQGKTIYLSHFLRDHVVSGPAFPAVFRRAILFAEGKSLETKKLLKDFASLCLEWHHHRIYNSEPSDNKFRLFRFKVTHGCGEWVYEGEKRARDAATVVLRKNLQEEIMKDFAKFLSEKSKNWYARHGVPRRRSILLYGTPGSGKTSMIKVLAGTFKLNACFLSLASKHVDNQVLNDAISSLPSEALLVLEDVDTLFTEDRKSEEGVNVTYSSLLQVLDGMPSGEGRLTVMTTNHIGKLDSAMIRCGRVDRMFHIGDPDKQQMEDYFETFYPESSAETRERFADSVLALDRPEKKSMATLQQFFIFAQELGPDVAVTRLDEFYEKYFEARLPKKSSILYS